MSSIKACIVKPFGELKGNVDIVVFRNERPYIPFNDSTEYIREIMMYARNNSCFVVSSLYEEEEHLNLCLVDNCGEFVGKQSAICLNTRYLEKFKKENKLKLIETRMGKIFLAVDVDIYRPEIIRLAAFRGCDLIISSQYFHNNDFSIERVLFGAWSESQANCKFVVNSTNFKSSIISPCELTKDRSGFTASSEFGDVYGEIDMLKTEMIYRNFPVFDTMNPLLYSNNYRELTER
jgi:predicted amidohydrolase